MFFFGLQNMPVEKAKKSTSFLALAFFFTVMENNWHSTNIQYVNYMQSISQLFSYATDRLIKFSFS